MALLFMEGFANTANDVSHKWDAGSSVFSIVNTNPSPRITGNVSALMYQTTLKKTITASNKVIVGCASYFPGTAFNEISFFGDAGTVKHISVTRNASTSKMEIRRGAYNGTLLATSTVTIPRDVWVYIEASVTISETVGEVHVRINGDTTDIVSFTGDTKNGGTNDTIDAVSIMGSTGGGGNNHISDIYICNDSGVENNDFLGDVAVRTLSPNGNGNSSQLTGSDGNQTDNYLLVDEKPFNTTDYTYSSTSGHKDTYGMADLPAAASTVFGVQVNASMRKDDAGLGQARYVLRSGGTDYVGSTETLTTTATTYVGLYEQDPATTSAWTVSGVNSAEAGMEVV